MYIDLFVFLKNLKKMTNMNLVHFDGTYNNVHYII